MAPQPPDIEDHWSGRPFDTSELRIVRRIEERLSPLVERAHLPRFLLSQVFLVVAGMTCLVMLGEWFEPVMRGPRPVAVAGVAFACAVAAPALGMVLVGLWDLARGPLQHFAPDWYERLTH